MSERISITMHDEDGPEGDVLLTFNADVVLKAGDKIVFKFEDNNGDSREGTPIEAIARIVRADGA